MERCAVCHEERLGVNAANGMPTCGRADCLLAAQKNAAAWREALDRVMPDLREMCRPLVFRRFLP